MRIKLFTLSALQDELPKDQTVLNDFFKKNQVLQIETAYVGVGETLWSVAVFYEVPKSQKATLAKSALNEAPRKLSDSDLKSFEALKNWRGGLAKRLKIAPYRIASDRELKVLVEVRPTDLTALGEIRGFGKVKVTTYGKLILEQLRVLHEK